MEDEIEQCMAVCRFERTQGRGSFLSAFIDAFMRADPSNKLILLPAMKKLIEKYNLKSQL